MAVAIEYKVLAGMNEVANKLPSIIKERNAIRCFDSQMLVYTRLVMKAGKKDEMFS